MPVLDQHANFFMYFQNSFKTAMEGYHFLEYSFIGEDDAAKHETSSSDWNIEEVVDVEPIDEVEFVNEVEAVPRKQKFFNLDDVLCLENYDILPGQEPSQFHYTNTKGQFNMHCHTKKQYQSSRAPGPNFLRHQLGPCETARNVTNPLAAFSLNITNDLLSAMVDYTNASTQHFGNISKF